MTSDSRQNQLRPEGTGGLQPPEGSQWPYCNVPGGACVGYEIGKRVGADVGSSLFGFIINAEEGARLVLQKNSKGFTVQVTSAVQR